MASRNGGDSGRVRPLVTGEWGWLHGKGRGEAVGADWREDNAMGGHRARPGGGGHARRAWLGGEGRDLWGRESCEGRRCRGGRDVGWARMPGRGAAAEGDGVGAEHGRGEVTTTAGREGGSGGCGGLEKCDLALYHVGKPNPGLGLGAVLV
jgi:hypothetical protein